MIVDFTLNRKIRITRIANPSPSRPSTVRSLMLSSINGAWSKIVTTVTSVARAVFKSGIRSWIPRETSTELPSGVFVIEIARVSLPLVRAIEVIGASS